jgi:hypothetical protein
MPKNSRLVSAAAVAAFVALAAGITPALAETVDFSGYLYDERTEVRFDVVAETELLDVTFTYPATADFHVKVLGQTGKELGDFSLAEGPVIELKGGGKFTFVVYTESGGGAWTAFYER